MIKKEILASIFAISYIFTIRFSATLFPNLLVNHLKTVQIGFFISFILLAFLPIALLTKYNHIFERKGIVKVFGFMLSFFYFLHAIFSLHIYFVKFFSIRYHIFISTFSSFLNFFIYFFLTFFLFYFALAIKEFSDKLFRQAKIAFVFTIPILFANLLTLLLYFRIIHINFPLYHSKIFLIISMLIFIFYFLSFFLFLLVAYEEEE